MGVYVSVTLENGQKIAWMEIFREHDLKPEHSMTPNQPGMYPYRFKYNGGKRGVAFGSGVMHERTEDVFALIRAVLNHSEQINPEYCGGCHCQFLPARTEDIIGDGPFPPLYRKVPVGEA